MDSEGDFVTLLGRLFGEVQVLLDSSEEYMIGKKEAERIINEVKDGVSRWKPLAIRLGIAKREIEVFEHIYKI